MNNFWQRLITGVVFVGVIVGATLFNEYSFLVLLTNICIFGLIEYYRIVFKNQFHYSQVIFILFGIAIVWMKFWFDEWFAYAIAMIFPLAAIMVLLSGQRNWKHIGYLMGGLLYIALPLFFFHIGAMKSTHYSDSPYMIYKPLLALNLFILIWSSDTFAYLSGRAFGKRKLFESISPKKTWEGFIGGAVLTIGISFLLAYLWHIPYRVNIAVALCTVVFGTLGDLVESMLKREFDVKDSGNVLPGHGGVLDRFDALLVSLPFTTFCYYIWSSIL